MDKLREELYKFIETYGFLDPRTVSKSQELDKLINIDIKKRALCREPKIKYFINSIA